MSTIAPQNTVTPWVPFAESRVRWTDKDGGTVEQQSERLPIVELAAPVSGMLLGSIIGKRIGGAPGMAIGAGVGLLAGVGAGVALTRGYENPRTSAMTRSEWDRTEPTLRERGGSQLLAMSTGAGSFFAAGMATAAAMSRYPKAAMPVSLGAAIVAGAVGYATGKAIDD